MRDRIGKLWIQTCIATSFRCDIFCVLTLITQKLQVAYGSFTYQMTALLLKMSIFCVRAEYEIWLVSYQSKHASQSLSDKQFVPTYMHNLESTDHIYMDVLHIEWLRWPGVSEDSVQRQVKLYQIFKVELQLKQPHGPEPKAGGVLIFDDVKVVSHF